ncbi:hypothetical protein F4804DRAFT_298032 [Jackrogersella minutella]|nr:hypothetical protein F4804DRAFT_298032 [Jackrogersella minutella]
MLSSTTAPRPSRRETRMENEGYAATGESGRTPEYREPITMTFEPHESSPSSLRSPSRLLVLAESNDSTSLSNLEHQRQQSASNQSSSLADTRTGSPKRGHLRNQLQGMPLTGDGRGGRRSDISPSRRGGWLSGSSTPRDGRASPDITPKTKRNAPAETTPKSATRFGFLASSMSALTTRLTTTPTPPDPDEVDDALCSMDIEAALFPASPTADRDTFSPAAYKNLQATAAGLLHKMQDACRRRSAALQDARAEREAQLEEAEEASVRTRHFKSQLESMAAKAAAQEQAMQRLMAELQAEKQALREERARREKMLLVADGPLITEDLCVDEDHERKRWRKSDGTVRSDLSIDTDGESAESESIFSRSRSPTATASTAADGEYLSARTPPALPVHNNKPKAAPQQMSTFQRLVKGIASKDAAGVDECNNCRGQDSSVAWDTVSLLRDENRSLKHRVAELEVVVDGALDVVNGIGLS